MSTTKDTKRYTETIGRRKTSSARVRLTPATKMEIHINGRLVNDYFKTSDLLRIVHDPFTKLKLDTMYTITAKIKGGGIHSQAEALRHGIARALTEINTELHTKLKKAGFLKRDPRAKERRKFGLKKARKAPQWSKR